MPTTGDRVVSVNGVDLEAVTHDAALGGCDDDLEFELALDVILDGLERLRAEA